MNNDLDRKVVDKKTGQLRPIRIAIVDIEATELKADRGHLLCVSIKEVLPNSLKGKVVTIRIDDKRNKAGVFNDKWVVQEAIKECDKYDLLVGWYSSRYDFPFINTRAQKYHTKELDKEFRRDLCLSARGKYCLTSNRLANWGKFLFGKSGKTFLDFDIWKAADRGDKKAIAYICDHCEADVIETERIYKRFMPGLGKLRKR